MNQISTFFIRAIIGPAPNQSSHVLQCTVDSHIEDASSILKKKKYLYLKIIYVLNHDFIANYFVAKFTKALSKRLKVHRFKSQQSHLPLNSPVCFYINVHKFRILSI